MTDPFDTPFEPAQSNDFSEFNESIEDELGITSDGVQLLGEMIIEDTEGTLFDEDTAFDDQDGQENLDDDFDEDEELDEHPAQGNEEEFADEDQLVALPDGSEITVHELIRGNLRDADYRHKTMELADERRQVTSERDQISEIAETLIEEREWMAQILQSQMPPMPDPSMAHMDPIAYEHALMEHDAARQNLSNIAQNQQHAVAQSTYEDELMAEQSYQEALAQEYDAMLQDNPEFEDPKEFQAFQNDAVDHFQDYGFTAEEIESVGDHRFIKVMRDAMAYQQLKAAKPQAMQKLKNRPPIMDTAPRKSARSRVAKNVKDRISNASTRGDSQSVSDILGQLLGS